MIRVFKMPVKRRWPFISRYQHDWFCCTKNPWIHSSKYTIHINHNHDKYMLNVCIRTFRFEQLQWFPVFISFIYFSTESFLQWMKTVVRNTKLRQLISDNNYVIILIFRNIKNAWNRYYKHVNWKYATRFKKITKKN